MGLNFDGLFRQNRFIDSEGIRRTMQTVHVSQDGLGDTDSVQDALNIVDNTNGGTIYIKEGNYTLPSAGITIKSNVSVIGSGYSTKITTPATGGGMHISSSNIQIKGIRFAGTGDENRAIDWTSATNCLIENCWFDNWSFDPYAAVTLTTCAGIKINKCHFTSSNKMAILLIGCSECIISDCIFEGLTGVYLRTTANTKNRIENNTFKDLISYGVMGWGAAGQVNAYNIITGNTFNACATTSYSAVEWHSANDNNNLTTSNTFSNNGTNYTNNGAGNIQTANLGI